MFAKQFFVWFLLRAVVCDAKGLIENQFKLLPLPTVEKDIQKVVSGKSSHRMSSSSSSIVANGKVEDGKHPSMKKGGTKATSSMTTVEESKMLPWQATLILKTLFPNRYTNGGKNSVSPPSTTVSSSLSSSFTRGRKWMNTKSGKFLAHCLQMMEQGVRRLYDQFALHRRSLVVGLQGLLIAAVVVAVLRRLGNWYKGMAEYELLLDSTDYEYQAYGGCFNGIGSSLMSSMNMTAIR